MNKWRVGNISLAIMLILLGILLLFSQIYKSPVLELIATWWPIIIILLGIEVLIFIPLSQKENSPISFDFMSILVIFFTLFASVFIYAANNFMSGKINLSSLGINFNRFETTVQKNFTIDTKDKKRFELSNPIGDIVLEKGSNNTLEINAEIVIKNNDEPLAIKTADTLIKVEDGNTIKVSSQRNSKMDSHINYRIKMPSNLFVDVKNKYGHVELAGLDNKVNTENTNGDITIDNLKGDLSLRNAYGNINLHKITGTVNLGNKNGQIEVSDVTGKVDVDSAYGNIDIENVPNISSIVNKNGNISVSNREKYIGDVSINNSYGNIEFSIAKEQNGRFDISTQHGNISSDLDFPISKDPSRQTMTGQIFDDKVKFIITNKSGNISIDKM